MFRPCWVIFREKLAVVVTLGCTIQLSSTVQCRSVLLLTKKLFVHLLVLMFFVQCERVYWICSSQNSDLWNP
jgi:hypothetical protein